jgi:hypothetical protein
VLLGRFELLQAPQYLLPFGLGDENDGLHGYCSVSWAMRC